MRKSLVFQRGSWIAVGLTLGWLIGQQPDREVRAAAGELLATTAALHESCSAVDAVNSYLVAIGVGDLTRAEALGLIPSPPIPPAGFSGAIN